MIKISVVINTLNEEENLPVAISSVEPWAYEVVVVDMHSDDGTVETAKSLGAKVYYHERIGYVEPARNYAISKAKGDWIFILDADEEVPSTLVKELLKEASCGEFTYFALPRKNIVFGKWLKNSRWWPDYNIRFFKKGAVKWNRKIHSVPKVIGRGKELKGDEKFAIVHHHYASVSQYLIRHDRYSSIMAREKFENGEKFNWRLLISKPAGEFLSRFFLGQGYKDGVHGLALSSLQAFVELLTYLKLWELNKFPEKELSVNRVVSEIKKMQREVNYWTADALVNETNSLFYRLKRKFRLP